MRDGQNHLVGKTRQAQGLRLTSPESQLIQMRQFQHRLLRGTRGKQIRDGLAVGEGLLAAARKLDQIDAGQIGQARLASLGEFADFGVGDIQGSKLGDAIEPHACLVERRSIGLLGALTR